MCDQQYGIPYSQFPQQNEVFYNSPNPDPYKDITNSSYQQLFQLQRNSLLPQSWSDIGPSSQAQSEPGQSDWYKYAPDADGFNKYIIGTGASRMRVMTRNPAGRLFGAPNLLRTNPAVPLSSSEPWFNGSGLRTDLINSLGCGPNPPGS
jgi:hypothetical protein